ncbi:hypothetical protein F4808DRAFT_473092 [Astrocystis sublimbata]|nr:hypothetical protein F4808DRAFT_473092 [Astrocystis sublimbata]
MTIAETMFGKITYSEPRRIWNREYCTSSDGKNWRRRIKDGTVTEWELCNSVISEAGAGAAPTTALQNNILFLVRQAQTTGRYHWSLAIAGEDGGPSQLYHVKGDHTHMRYAHASDVNIFVSDSYYDSLKLADLDGHGRGLVDHVANSQPPPTAKNAASITETCQGWTVRVIADLEVQGVVPVGTTDKVRPMMQPLS